MIPEKPKKQELAKKSSAVNFKVTNYCFNDFIDSNFRQMNPVLNRYYNSYKKDEITQILEKRKKKEEKELGLGIGIGIKNFNVY